MSLYDDASLIMFPSGYKEDKIYSLKPTDGSGDLTFTRASTATRVNSDGLIETSPVNLQTYSEDFTNGKYTLAAASITSNATNAPNGTATADKLVENTANVQHYIYFTSQQTAYNETRISVYAKSGGRTKLVMWESAITNAQSLFDLSTGVVTSSSSGNAANLSTTVAQIEDAGNGWYRCSFNYSTSSGGGTIRLQLYTTTTSYTGDGTSGVFLWGLQENIGATAKTYFPTTDRLDVPRIDYTGGGCGKLLLESQRTNLVTYSEQIDNAAWSKFRSSVTANATTSPDGSTNAEKLIQQSAENDGGGVYQSIVISNATAYTYSFFAKAAGYNFAIARVSNSPSDFYAWFDLSNGVVGSTTGGVTSSSIVSYGNGWYRCSMTFTSVVTSATPHIYIANSNGSDQTPAADGVKGIFAYGAHFEAGSYVSSYIPTLASSVTRLADTASKTGISSLIGQTEGVLFVDFIHNNPSVLDQQFILAINSSNTDNFVVLQTYNGKLNPAVRASSVNIFDVFAGPDPLTEGRHRVALAYKSGDFAIYLDGTQIFTSNNSATFGTMGQVDLGTLLTFNSQLGNGIYSSILYTTRLTNTQLATLTTL